MKLTLCLLSVRPTLPGFTRGVRSTEAFGDEDMAWSQRWDRVV